MSEALANGVLHRLAERCGIVASFRDARGEIRNTGAQTTRELLAAMRLPAWTDEEAEDTLRRLEVADWTTPLPPVHVVHRGRGPESWMIPVTTPSGSGPIGWHLRCEDGTAFTGEGTPDLRGLDAKRTIEGVDFERRLLCLPDQVADGYHRLTLNGSDAACELIVSPGRCWLPPEVRLGHRLWGVSTQLYLLRSERNWGIGDYTDLARLGELLQPLGADIIGLNPLHAMFVDAPEHASPYSPANRLLLNVLNIDVDAAARSTGCAPGTAGFPEEALECRSARRVQYAQVAALKLTALERLFDRLDTAPNSPHSHQFEDFRRAGGESLERGCVFFALREHFTNTQGSADWHTWPEAYRSPMSAEVRRFARERARRVRFQAWLQFVADQQLGEAARSARGMAVGIYRDLAVGADPSGAETWTEPSSVIEGVHVGAPPDIYNPAGQDWGLPPLNPHELRAQGYRHFIALLRANMRHAGGLRIDHAMGLEQLYWVPSGVSPAEGAYVRYPRDDLLGILALESQRNRCLVVGEDLGTVPEGFRERMAEVGVLSYRVLIFERDSEKFIAPEAYPPLALAVAGSHDLPTLRSWWSGADLRLKEDLHLYPAPADADRARGQRVSDRAALTAAFRREGMSTESLDMGEHLFCVAHRFLARTACALAIAQLDDLTGETEPVNVPTTSNQHPNWRRRLSVTLEGLAADPRLRTLAKVFNEERGNKRPPPDPLASSGAMKER